MTKKSAKLWWHYDSDRCHIQMPQMATNFLLLLALLTPGSPSSLRYEEEKQEELANLVYEMKELFLTRNRKVAFFLDFAADKRIDLFFAAINSLHVPYHTEDRSLCPHHLPSCFRPNPAGVVIFMGNISKAATLAFRNYYHICWVSQTCAGKDDDLRALNDMNVIVLCQQKDGRFLAKWLDLETDRYCAIRVNSELLQDAIEPLLNWPQLYDLMGCVVNVSVLPRAPAVIWDNSTLSGWEVMLLNSSIAKLNGTVAYRILSNVPIFKFDDLQTHHVLAGMIHPVSRPSLGLHMVGTKVFGTVVLVTPYIPLASFSVVTDIFDYNYRIILLSSVLLVLCVTFLHQRMQHKASNCEALMASFTMLYLYFEQSTPVWHFRRIIRWGFLLWALFTMVINTSYRASLSQMLTTHRKPNFIEELDDVYKYTSDFTFYCRKSVFDHYKESLILANPNHVHIKQALKIVSDSANTTDILTAMVEKKQAMLFEVHAKVLYEMSRLPAEAVAGLHIVREPAYTVQFQLITSSHLNMGYLLDNILSAMSDNGVSREIVSNVMERPWIIVNQAKQPHRSVSVDDVGHVFIALMMGHALAFAVFVCENIQWRWNKRKFNVFLDDFSRVGPKNKMTSNKY